MTNDECQNLGSDAASGSLHSSFVIRHSSFVVRHSSFPFSALLLAGGRSSRMGRDKALLSLPGDERLLWQRQLDDVLRPLRPARLFFSGPAHAGLPNDVTVLADAMPGQLGPLAGITTALEALSGSATLLAVLAVDLPAMTAQFFQNRLLSRCSPGKGAVPLGADGFYEPLAAIYPRECRPLAAAQLRGPDRSLQAFVRTAQAAGLIAPVAIEKVDAPLFVNWNAPEDVAGSRRGES